MIIRASRNPCRGNTAGALLEKWFIFFVPESNLEIDIGSWQQLEDVQPLNEPLRLVMTLTKSTDFAPQANNRCKSWEHTWGRSRVV